MRSIVVVAGLAALTAASMTLWIARPDQPEWLAELADPRFRFPDSTPPSMTVASASTCRYIENDLLLRRLWTDREVGEVRVIMSDGYPKPIRTREDFSERMVFESAFAALSHRVRIPESMSEPSRRAGIEIMMGELSAEYPERRVNAGLSLLEAKAIEDPAVRREVERLLKDEDHEVAELIASHLAEYDRQRAAWHRRQLSKGR